jgi:sugar phosphate isomerase/epimerase
MLTIRTCGPGWLMKMAMGYWVRFYQYVGSLGFHSIEAPFSPYFNDPVAWEITRTGMPVSEFVVDAMYGGMDAYKKLLKESWIEEVSSLHVRAIDAYEEVKESFVDVPDNYFGQFEDILERSLDYLEKLGGQYLIISPSPELGIVKKYILKEDTPDALKDFEDRTIAIINEISLKAIGKGLTPAVTNEFWSVFRKEKLHELMGKLDDKVMYSPDLAHLYIQDEDIAETLRRYSERLACVKFNDTKFKDEEKNYLTLHPETPTVGKQKVFYDMGDGEIDFVGTYKTLRDAGYDGYVVFDTKKTTSIADALLKMRITLQQLSEQ